MDWTGVKKLIGTLAPWIAGTFGTPVAGIAVKAACDVFGLTDDKATPENLTAALAGATPDQLLALKQADLKHKEFMVQIGYDTLAKLEANDAADRDSARKMQIAKPSNWPGILSAITTLAVLGVIAARMANISLPQDAVTAQLVGSLTTAWGMAITYWFGTTRGSSEKNALLAQSIPAG